MLQPVCIFESQSTFPDAVLLYVKVNTIPSFESEYKEAVLLQDSEVINDDMIEILFQSCFRNTRNRPLCTLV